MAEQSTYTATNLPIDGETIDASDVNTDLQGLIDEFNKEVGESKIADDAVSIDKLKSESWATWTPTWTNLTIGNGTTIAKFQQRGTLVTGYLKFTFGSTSSIDSSNVLISLPVTGTANISTNTPIGQIRVSESGGTNYPGTLEMQTTTTAQLLTHIVSGSDVVFQTLSATDPFTWGTLDQIYISFTYEAVVS